MVRPEYQRQGLGRVLTKRCNEVADAGNAATYVRAQPESAGLFIQMGFDILEKVEVNLNDLGAQGGWTTIFFMKRDPGASEMRGKKLD